MGDEERKPLLEMKNITKRFPGVIALSKVDLALYSGEVHILMGENGAGKSTLMKVLSGAHEYDEGEIFINGNYQAKWGPSISQANGIAMVYQEFNLVPYRSVLDNMFLGREAAFGGIFSNRKKMKLEATQILNSLEIDIDPETLVADLGVAKQQMVEIAKALLFDAKILVLDEPTSALTVNETEKLFETIANLRKKGVGIFYISHRLEEIHRIGDRVSILRDGEYIGTHNVREIGIEKIVEMMVGREVTMMFPRNYRKKGEVAIKVENICNDKLKNVSLELRYGEILGLSGLVGAGRTEIARVIFGLDEFSSGNIEVAGVKYKKWNVHSAISNGIGYISEDRKDEGLFLNLSVQKNISIAGIKKISRLGFMNLRNELKTAWNFIRMLKIKTPGAKQKVGNLSGGNQQKVVVGKWLNTDPKILIFDEPTRGIDVGAKVEIHSLMDKLVNDGNAVIMISSDLPEVMGMSDRIIVMAEGNVKGEFLPEANPEDLIALAMGE